MWRWNKRRICSTGNLNAVVLDEQLKPVADPAEVNSDICANRGVGTDVLECVKSDAVNHKLGALIDLEGFTFVSQDYVVTELAVGDNKVL